MEMGRRVGLERDFAFGENATPLRLWSPNEFLPERLLAVSGGKALDLACGAGREAAALAFAGWDVTAVDHLPDALSRAESLAARFGQEGKIRWVEADLDTWSPDQAYDLITMFFLFGQRVDQASGGLARRGGQLCLRVFFRFGTGSSSASHGEPSLRFLWTSCGGWFLLSRFFICRMCFARRANTPARIWAHRVL